MLLRHPPKLSKTTRIRHVQLLTPVTPNLKLLLQHDVDLSVAGRHQRVRRVVVLGSRELDDQLHLGFFFLTGLLSRIDVLEADNLASESGSEVALVVRISDLGVFLLVSVSLMLSQVNGRNLQRSEKDQWSIGEVPRTGSHAGRVPSCSNQYPRQWPERYSSDDPSPQCSAIKRVSMIKCWMYRMVLTSRTTAEAGSLARISFAISSTVGLAILLLR